MSRYKIVRNMVNAEERFREWMKTTYPFYRVTKKGLPDFMVLNENDEVIGFVEVKRVDINDWLRKEQEYFRQFCIKNNIPYQVWSSNMVRERWTTLKETFKNRFRGAKKWLI